MPSQSEIEQTLKMFEHGTKQKWRIIPKSQAKYYPQPGQKNHYWVLCLDTSCKGQIYVVPKGLKPHYSDYDKILRFLRETGLPLLPKIKLNVADADAVPYYIVLDNHVLKGAVKLVGTISIKSLHSKSPLSYTPGQLASLQFNGSEKINRYLKSWDSVGLVHDVENGKIKLKVSNSITNEFYNFDVTLVGGVFSTTITVTPAKTHFAGWDIESPISLTITGKLSNDGFDEGMQTKVAKLGGVQTPSFGYSIYHMVGIGVGSRLGLVPV